MAQVLLMFHYCDLPLQQAWSLCGGTRRKSGRDSTGVCKCLPGIKMIHLVNLYNKAKHWQPREGKLGRSSCKRRFEEKFRASPAWLRSLSSLARRDLEVRKTSKLGVDTWRELCRFTLLYLLHSFANVLQWFLDLLLLVSWFWFWENCMSWWSLYFHDLRIKPFPSAV